MYNDNKKYILVGGFVLVSIAIIFVYFFWLGSFDKVKYNTYLIVSDESAIGINRGSKVTYNGVLVGIVDKLVLSPKDLNHISIFLKVDQRIPITNNSYATISQEGFVGNKIIDIKFDDSTHKRTYILETSDNNPTSIPIRPSNIAQITDLVQKTIEKLDNIFNKNSIMEIKNTIYNLDIITSSISKNINAFWVNSNRALRSIRLVADELDGRLEDKEFDIEKILQNSINQFSYTMYKLDNLINQTRVLTEELSDSPSDLLYKYRTPSYGPGEN